MWLTALGTLPMHTQHPTQPTTYPLSLREWWVASREGDAEVGVGQEHKPLVMGWMGWGVEERLMGE